MERKPLTDSMIQDIFNCKTRKRNTTLSSYLFIFGFTIITTAYAIINNNATMAIISVVLLFAATLYAVTVFSKSYRNQKSITNGDFAVAVGVVEIPEIDIAGRMKETVVDVKNAGSLYVYKEEKSDAVQDEEYVYLIIALQDKKSAVVPLCFGLNEYVYVGDKYIDVHETNIDHTTYQPATTSEETKDDTTDETDESKSEDKSETEEKSD